ncbi:MAG: hypothetical protein A2170_01020, partial [Deltaproteobacteria bacterium RBG_13_53_10]
MSHHNGKRKPSLRSFFANLRADMPWRNKIHLLFRNNWIKMRNLQDCCGHPGEPGCSQGEEKS